MQTERQGGEVVRRDLKRHIDRMQYLSRVWILVRTNQNKQAIYETEWETRTLTGRWLILRNWCLSFRYAECTVIFKSDSLSLDTH